eukprot:2751015-Ditylum_brightwellii.AAC.1
MSLEGNSSKQVKELRKIAEKWADRVQSCHIKKCDAWLYFESTAITLPDKVSGDDKKVISWSLSGGKGSTKPRYEWTINLHHQRNYKSIGPMQLKLPSIFKEITSSHQIDNWESDYLMPCPLGLSTLKSQIVSTN